MSFSDYMDLIVAGRYEKMAEKDLEYEIVLLLQEIRCLENESPQDLAPYWRLIDEAADRLSAIAAKTTRKVA